MGDVSSGCTIREVLPNPGVVCIKIETAATVDDGDTIAVTLADYGMKTLEGVIGFIHTTTDSVIVQEQPTTSVTSGVATITVGGSTDDKKRVYFLFGDSV